MPAGAYPQANAIVDNTSAASFIPKLWSDEIRAAYEQEPSSRP